MSLQLDTGNFKRAWIDGKIAHELWFRGDQIYSSKKYILLGFRLSTASSLLITYGGTRYPITGSSLYNKGTTKTVGGISYGSKYVGEIAFANPTATKILEVLYTSRVYTGQSLILKPFPTKILFSALRSFLDSEGLKITDVKIVSMFMQKTYAAEYEVFPYIFTATSISRNKNDQIIAPYASAIDYGLPSIGRGTNLSCDVGLKWTYPAEKKGKILAHVFEIPEDEKTAAIETINKWSISDYSFTMFPAAQFRRVGSTNFSKTTAYGNTLLLLEVDYS